MIKIPVRQNSIPCERVYNVWKNKSQVEQEFKPEGLQLVAGNVSPIDGKEKPSTG